MTTRSTTRIAVHDTRSIYWLALVLAYVCSATGLASQAPSSAGPLSRPIAVYVFTAQPKGLIPFDQRTREESVKHLQNSLGDELPKKLATVTPLADGVDVTVEVLGRKADGHDLMLYLRVRVGNEAFDVEGLNDDNHWNDAAHDASEKIAEWLKVNEDFLQARRR